MTSPDAPSSQSRSPRNPPRPTPDTRLYPYGDYLADADVYLYKPAGEPDILDGKHATFAAIEAEADDYATRPLSEFTTYAGK